MNLIANSSNVESEIILIGLIKAILLFDLSSNNRINFASFLFEFGRFQRWLAQFKMYAKKVVIARTSKYSNFP